MSTNHETIYPKNVTANDRKLIDQIVEASKKRAHWLRTMSCVNDYAAGDPAQAKLEDAVVAHTHFAHFSHTFVSPFDTLSGSYNILTQILAPEAHLPKGKVGYLNVAPIADSDDRNGHHPFLGVLLTNGRLLFSPNSGYSLSLIAPYADVIFEMPCANNGEQFRSWQCFPAEMGRIFRNDFSNVSKLWTRDGDHPIPKPPTTQFACPDNFGNVKSLLRLSDIAKLGIVDGDIIEILVDGAVTAEAVYGRNVKKLAGPRLLSFAPGSGLIQGHADAPVETFIDLFRLRDSALDLIGEPTYEQEVSFRKKSTQQLNIALFDRHDVLHRAGTNGSHQLQTANA